MDKKKSILNVCVSVASKIATMILAILLTRVLIRTCGNGVNGLNALYVSIIDFLSVTELGVGTAITFCMYKPIVEKDGEKVAALYGLFRRLYRIIGGVIFGAGLVLLPFLPLLAKDYTQLNVDLYGTFLLILVSVVITYLFGARTALLNAYKNNYISTAISSGGTILQYLLQMAVLWITGSFVGYLGCRIVSVLLRWLATELLTRRRYAAITNRREKLDKETQSGLLKNIKAMFMHKIGTTLVNTTDSIIISYFAGVFARGNFSNYSMLMAGMTGVLRLVFTSLTSVIGHLYVEKSRQETLRCSELLHWGNFMLGSVCYLGYYAIADAFVGAWFGRELVAEKAVVAVLVVNGFVQFMRTNTLTFRDASGAFYYDRWKPLAEGVCNVVLSVILVQYIGVVGVIAATVVTSLVICHVVEPYVLYKHAFQLSPKKYYVKNYGLMVLFGGELWLMDCCLQRSESLWMGLVVNGGVSLLISLSACLCCVLLNQDLRRTVGGFLHKR